MPAQAFIGLGSNLVHPRRQLARAVRALRRIGGVRVLSLSPNYVSAPIDSPEMNGAPAPDYVNAVARIASVLTPRTLLRRLQQIERRHGRVHDATARNLPRTLDLDLLLFASRRVHTPSLSLPHPRMHQRAFVLRPLRDIAPHQVIPGIGLARFRLHAVRTQRIARTRSHRRT